MKQRSINLDSIEITVIDEADHMADLGFLPSVTRILAATRAAASDCCSPQHSMTASTSSATDSCATRAAHSADYYSAATVLNKCVSSCYSDHPDVFGTSAFE